MSKLYEFVSGPALWVAFAIFIGGLIARVGYLYAVVRESKDASHNRVNFRKAVYAIVHWLIPVESDARLQSKPVFVIASFLFHICLPGIPLFVFAHNTLWEETFGFSLPSLPDHFSDVLTVMFLISVLLVLTGKIFDSKMRSMSTIRNYFLLLLSSAPFITGFLAHRQIGPYRPTLILHMVFAEMLLIIIPFSMGHFVLFFRGK
jgi:nitrate reductase gamma subunit